MLIDIANLEWWQTLVAIVGVLGLSPAPWILGLATGRIQFTGPATAERDKLLEAVNAAHALELKNLALYHAGILAEKDEKYADVKVSRDGYKKATIIERERADKATDALAEFAELGAAFNQGLQALGELEKDART